MSIYSDIEQELKRCVLIAYLDAPRAIVNNLTVIPGLLPLSFQTSIAFKIARHYNVTSQEAVINIGIAIKENASPLIASSWVS